MPRDSIYIPSTSVESFRDIILSIALNVVGVLAFVLIAIYFSVGCILCLAAISSS